MLATLSSGVVLLDLRKGGRWVLDHEEAEDGDDGIEADEEQVVRRTKKR